MELVLEQLNHVITLKGKHPVNLSHRSAPLSQGYLEYTIVITGTPVTGTIIISRVEGHMGTS